MLAIWFTDEYKNSIRDGSYTSQILRQVGILSLESSAADTARRHAIDFIVLIECVIVRRLRKRVGNSLTYTSYYSGDTITSFLGDQHESTRGSFKTLETQYVAHMIWNIVIGHWTWSMIALGVAAASFPSILSVFYAVMFIAIGLGAALFKCDYDTWTTMKTLAMTYTSLHLLFLYIYQFDFLQEQLPNLYYVGFIKFQDVTKFKVGYYALLHFQNVPFRIWTLSVECLA